MSLAGSAKLRQARLGQLPPSDVSPMLRHFQKPWENRYSRPLVKGFLFLVYWFAAGVDALQRIVWSLVHIFYMLWFYLSTIWRIEMIVPVRTGKREAVFALSKPQKLADVKTIQHAFSGNEPGDSQRGWKGHITINDVLCAIMADVVSVAIERRRYTYPSGPVVRWFNRFLPMPIGFFMLVLVTAGTGPYSDNLVTQTYLSSCTRTMGHEKPLDWVHSLHEPSTRREAQHRADT